MDKMVLGKLITTLLVASIGGVLGVKSKIPAGALIGALVFVAGYNILFSQAYLPKQFSSVAQILIGAMIGLNFRREYVVNLKNIIAPSIIMVVGLCVFSLALGYIIYKVTGMDIYTAMFSASPGGLTEMAIVSGEYGADQVSVVTMHLIRLMVVITLLPRMITFIANKFV